MTEKQKLNPIQIALEIAEYKSYIAVLEDRLKKAHLAADALKAAEAENKRLLGVNEALDFSWENAKQRWHTAEAAIARVKGLPKYNPKGQRILYGRSSKDAQTGEVSELFVKVNELQAALEKDDG